MPTPEEHIAALRDRHDWLDIFLADATGDAPSQIGGERAALEWAIEQLSFAVKKEGEHGHTSTERNQDRSD